MEIKQFKASLQLAKMRLDADPSEANQAKYDQAKQAYDSCQNIESQKIEQVSGKSEIFAVPEDTGKADDVAGKAFKETQKQSRAHLAILKAMTSIVNANSVTVPKEPEKSENPEKSAEPAADQPLISTPPVVATPTEAVPAAENEEKKKRTT